MKPIVIATCRAYPTLSDSNARLKSALEDAGYAVSVLSWNSDDLQEFLDSSLVLLRQTWDYQDDPGGFAAWASRASMKGCNIQNSPELAIWNNDKRSILECADAEVNVPASCDPDQMSAEQCFEFLQTDNVVLKPAFGGSGVGVRISDQSTFPTELSALKQDVPGRPLIAQEYLPEITEGEWKLTCVNGEVVFAVHLTPKPGEFRVNSRYSPTMEIATPPTSATEAALNIHNWLGVPVLSTRVDGVIRNQEFICTELELTDPDLHLHLSDNGTETFVNAVEEFFR